MPMTTVVKPPGPVIVPPNEMIPPPDVRVMLRVAPTTNGVLIAWPTVLLLMMPLPMPRVEFHFRQS